MGKWIDKTTIRFLLVGVINTLVGTSVMFLAYNLLGLNYWISSASNYVIGSIVSFLLNKYFTFEKKEKEKGELFRFVVNITGCYLIAYGVAKPLVRLILSGWPGNIQDNAAMFAGMCFFVVLNYFGQRYFVFRKRD